MDHWDPAFVNPLAAQRPIVLIDNSGIGRSSGESPETVAAMAQVYIDAIRAIGLSQADLLGFSLGGAVAQMAALNAPTLIRRLVLCGTIPSYGEGVVSTERHFLQDSSDPRATVKLLVNSHGRELRKLDPTVPHFLTSNSANKQAAAFSQFMNPDEAKDGSYNRLDEVQMPVLIMGASDDILMPTDNSILIWKKLRNHAGRLHLFPDSGHGFLFQHAKSAAVLVNAFLDSDVEN
ncbi:hypothetical protein QQX98_009623 [Neonectria punicea]|uniref:AB hydrolase-1 domain-containing protein n=1 Tax=Neonectria punicea TaxID=979145 RepID=A0ABR1GRY7_9HYPO